MRALLLCIALCFASTAQAGLLDLLPLKRIERKMLYPLSAVEVDPAVLGLQNATVSELTHDGERLIVWTLKAQKPGGATILYFHGNAGNLALRAERFDHFQKQGFNVIAMSYRGSSGSTGLPSESGITKDALHVYRNAAQLATVAGPDQLVLYGESLGSAVAIALLAALPESERPAGLILEAPFTSTPEMAQTMAELPPALIARISDRWDSLSRGSAITIPLLVLHGTRDAVTPIEMGRRLFANAVVKDKDFIAVQGATHSTTWRSDTLPRMHRFIRRYTR